MMEERPLRQLIKIILTVIGILVGLIQIRIAIGLQEMMEDVI